MGRICRTLEGMNPSLYFLAAKRTPFGANGGALKDKHPRELAVHAARAALSESGVAPTDIDHVIFGSVLSSTTDSIYLPRHVGLQLGIPEAVPALGINRLCGTGFQVVVEAFQQISVGDTQVAVVGGVENMSMSPYWLTRARAGFRMGHSQVVDSLMEGLTDSGCQLPMAMTAENLAVQYGISRADSDAFALQSQQRAARAWEARVFEPEIAPMTECLRDEHVRPDATLESLSKLKAVFKKDGTVTAGNASGIVDGAAALVVASEAAVKARGLRPLGRLVGYGISGCDPKIMGIGPVPAIQSALAKTGMRLDQMDLLEINEAFAPQALAVAKELKIDPSRLNANGGAIAIGHPLAASGTRILGHLLHQLRKHKLRYGLGAACIGGGQGIAMIVEAG